MLQFFKNTYPLWIVVAMIAGIAAGLFYQGELSRMWGVPVGLIALFVFVLLTPTTEEEFSAYREKHKHDCLLC